MFTVTDDVKSGRVNTKSSLRSRERSKIIFYITMAALPVIQFLVFYLYINFDSFTLAFQEYSFEQGQYVWYGFKNFATIFENFKTQVDLRSSVTNSLDLFFWTMIFSAFVAILFSYYIFKKNFGHKAFKIILYLPGILGGVVVVIMYRFFVELAIPEIVKLFGNKIEGLLTNPNTVLATIVFYTIYTSFGTQVLVYSSTMSSISESIIESAQLDGITPMKELIHIVLPSIWPTFVTFMVASIVGIFTNQMSLFTFYGTTADPNLYTFGYYLYRYVTLAELKDYPYLSALGLLLTLIATPVTLFTRWALVKFGPSRD